MKIQELTSPYQRATYYAVDLDDECVHKYVLGEFVEVVYLKDFTAWNWDWLNRNLPPAFLAWLPER